MIGIIRGTGSYVPAEYLDNNDLAQMVETSDEWIKERTGIARRHIAKTDTAVSMAVKAAQAAIENAGIAPEELDLILVSTISSEVILPCAACMVQDAIGAVNALCFDLNAACTGFLLAYNTAQAYIHSGLCRKALVIGTEKLSNLVDWTDRGTCILFGDGAGAAVLEAADGAPVQTVTGSDGAKGIALTCANLSGQPRPEEEEQRYMHMDGQAVFRFAVTQVPAVIQELLEKTGLQTEDIDLFVLHQANRRIIESVAKRLGISMEKLPVNVNEYGNTSSASIPILLDELNRKGILQSGQKIVLAGFGAGLSWGATLVEWA